MNTSYYSLMLSYHFVFRTHYLSVTMDCGYEFYNYCLHYNYKNVTYMNQGHMMNQGHNFVSLVVQTNLSPHILPGTRDSNLYP